ncbi:hypothetical protein GYMLUDRAFT_49028 [Collybiopsis luxurians FD-317 M1]|uniref:Unplaced genomic scaffold GYMLUscaffold_72, whole genome shotgun sequence n=1 Tax=Collybiopsis luxurians FD-317 M1 TaxID=944289 RepID=A0A0D0AU91_9AGAR|nr:hypothetical protein GYMLUDRAFT_49028 [Collybiopsis luxurians FD-317 M1]
MTIIYKIHALKDDRLGFPPAFNSNYLRNSNRLKHGTWQGKGKGKEKEIGLRKGGRRRKCREEKAKPLATQPTREMIPREARAKAHARIEAMSNSSEDTTLGHEDASIHSNNSADSTYPSSTSATSATINASEENSASEDVSQLAADAEFTITSTDGAKRTFRIIEVLYTGNGVVGRGPTVYRVECIDDGVLPAGSTPWLHRVLIAKFYFPSATRTAENVLVMKARDSANKSDEWALEHLPEIIDCVDLTSIHDDSVQKRLYELLGSKSYEQRILRVSFHEPLEPLMNLKSPLELAQVIYDIVQIHQWLCEVPKILHRDISIGNIMFKRVGDKVFGVLNDFDLAFCPEYSEQPSSKHRTGTTPFMAYDLLDNDWKRGHMYRHDLESIFYVLLIVCCHYEEFGRPLPSEERPYLDWFTESATTVSKSKFKFVASPPTGPLPIQPLFEDFRDWLEDSLSQFQAGFVSKPQRRKPQDQYDWATLGGNVTYKEMNKILCLFQGTPLVRRWQGAGVSDR